MIPNLKFHIRLDQVDPIKDKIRFKVLSSEIDPAEIRLIR
jgi:hypothetical protein